MNRIQFSRYIEPLRIVLFMGAMILLARESYWLDNTIHGLHLFWGAFIIGCLLGFIPSLIFGYFHHNLLGGLVGPVARTLQFSLLTALTFGLLFPACASFVNREYLTNPSYQDSFVITKKALGGKGHTPFVFFEPTLNDTESIEVDSDFYRSVEVGQKMTLILQPGILGFNVVQSWKIASTNPSQN